MTDIQSLYILFNLFCLTAITWVHFKARTDRDRQQINILIDKIVVIFLFFLLCDLAWILVEGRPGKFAFILNNIINVAYMILLGLLAYEWLFLIGFNCFGKTILGPVQKYILSIPLLTLVSLSILSTKYNLIFSIDPETNVYSRGPLIYIQHAICYLYYIGSCGLLGFSKYKNQVHIHSTLPSTRLIFSVLPLIGGIASIFFPILPTTECCITLAILIFFGDMQISHISHDPLTGLNNQASFDKIIERTAGYKPSGTKLYVFLADIDNFKSININYNRAEGDDTLVEVAETLKDLCANTGSDLGRINGDEFIIFRKFKTEDEALSFKYDIIKSVYEKNNTDNRGYKVSVSVGFHEVVTDTVDTIMDSIRLTGKLMFEDKNTIRILDKKIE